MLAELALAAAIATSYAGQPVTVERGANGLNGYATPGVVHLAPHLYDSLADPRVFQPGRTRFVRAGYTTKADDWDAIALHVLIHEALHLRWPDAPEGAVECAALFTVPGVLERYYGVPMGSPRMMSLWWYRGSSPLDCGWFDGRALRRSPVGAAQ